MRAPIPTDDLLRDIIAGDYKFDYNNLYIYAPLLAKYNQYIAFDKILYLLSQHIGKIWTIRVVQLFCISAYITPLVLIFNKLLSHRPDKDELVTFCLAYTLISSIMIRLTLGRPEVILAAWTLFGIACGLYNNKLAKCLWVILGIVLIPTYWLSLLYVPTTLVVFKEVRTKILMCAVFAVLNLFIWQALSGGQWIYSFELLNKSLINRLPDALVNENSTIAKAIITPQVGLILVLLSYKIQLYIKWLYIAWCNDKKAIYVETVKMLHHKYIWLIILCIWFCLANMIRYIDVVMPILMIIFVDQYKDYKYTLGTVIQKNFVFIIAIYLTISNQMSLTTSPPKFNLPAGSRVLTSFDGANYYAPFFNKSKIYIAPSMEIGANEKGIQQLVVGIQKYKHLDCELLKRFNFQYIIEKDLNSKPSCLKLIDVQGAYRLWKME
jgi:hypothetical protein